MIEAISYEADEPCPTLVDIGVGLQGVLLSLAPLVLIVAFTARTDGQDERYLFWAVFAALIIAGGLTELQASPFWRFGAGHVLTMGPTPNFLAVSILARTEGGTSSLGKPDYRSLSLLLSIGSMAPLTPKDLNSGGFGHYVDADCSHGPSDRF